MNGAPGRERWNGGQGRLLKSSHRPWSPQVLPLCPPRAREGCCLDYTQTKVCVCFLVSKPGTVMPVLTTRGQAVSSCSPGSTSFQAGALAAIRGLDPGPGDPQGGQVRPGRSQERAEGSLLEVMASCSAQTQVCADP